MAGAEEVHHAAGQNGRGYVAIGRILVERGAFDQVRVLEAAEKSQRAGGREIKVKGEIGQ